MSFQRAACVCVIGVNYLALAATAGVDQPVTLDEPAIGGRLIRLPENIPIQRHRYDMRTGVLSDVLLRGDIDPDSICYANEPPPAYLYTSPAGFRIADDITTIAINGGLVVGYEVGVGGVGTGDPFTVDFALWDDCPSYGGQIIAGTEGSISLPDDRLYVIEVTLDKPIPIPQSFWFSTTFDSDLAGWIFAGQAEIGSTENTFDFPLFPCDAWTGIPGLFGGFHLRTFCDPSFDREFLAYLNADVDGPLYVLGAGNWITDDIKLIVDDCVLSSYEIAGQDNVPFIIEAQLRTSCSPAGLIPGTEGVASGRGDDTPEILRFDFPGGVQLPPGDTFYVSWRYSTDASAIIAGQAEIGSTLKTFGLDPDGCIFFSPNLWTGYNITLRCLGDAPLGACCDLGTGAPGTSGPDLCREVAEVDCRGPLARYSRGMKCPGSCSINSDTCATDEDCPDVCSDTGDPCPLGTGCVTGTCDSQVCTLTGVSFDPACGYSACCEPPDENGEGEGCMDRPYVETPDAAGNLVGGCSEIFDGEGRSALWQEGQYCDEGDQHCVVWACRFAAGACDEVHGNPGCNFPSCCDQICSNDPFCCLVDWDGTCVERVLDPNTGCGDLPIPNDDCADPDDPFKGALLLNRCSGGTPSSPGAICEVAEGDCKRCDSGLHSYCTNNSECSGLCVESGETCDADNTGTGLDGTEMSTGGGTVAEDGSETFCCHSAGPNLPGVGPIWAKFVASDTSAVIHTCDTAGASVSDSIIEVYAVDQGVPEEDACASRVAIGCSDSGGCEHDHARVCVHGLTIGDVYYIQLAAKSEATGGKFKLKIQSPCSDPESPSNNSCVNAEPVPFGGIAPFDLADATPECPGHACVFDLDADLWFNYTAEGSGLVTISTCGSSAETSLVVYDGDDCPIADDRRLPGGCNDGAGGACINGSIVTVNVLVGQNYLIRVGGKNAGAATGNLTVGAVRPDCQPNGREDVDDIVCGRDFACGTCTDNGAACQCALASGAGCQAEADAMCATGTCVSMLAGSDDCQTTGFCRGRPDECDIAIGCSQDCDLEGTPDECQNPAPCQDIDILGWESVGTHGQGVGEVGLAITQPNFSEPRLSGLSRLVVTYSAAINPATATPTAVTLVGNDSTTVGMDLSAHAIATNAIAGDTQLEITFTPKLPDFAKYRVTLTGVESAGGGATVGMNSVVVTALLGDADGNLLVLANDVGGVSNFVATIGIDPGIILQVRSDGNNDGNILPSDVGGVSNEVGKIATVIPDP